MVPCDNISPTRGVLFCGECGGTLWYLVQTVYSCSRCGLLVHAHCVAKIRRRCVASFLTEAEADTAPRFWDGSLQLSICPELSLAEQQFRCLECELEFTQFSSARLCDYTGGYYCHQCHWAAASPSPARIIHNWDFTPVSMCQAALQYLALVARRPLINLEKLNPSLSAVIHDVAAVVKMRQQLISMKKYLVVCRIAGEERLLTQLQDRQHFVDSAEMFSFRDLVDIHTGVLQTYLQAKIARFKSHLEEKLWLGRGSRLKCCSGHQRKGIAQTITSLEATSLTKIRRWRLIKLLVRSHLYRRFTFKYKCIMYLIF